eukprot:scaffold20819_cov108-Isochrysis_galbana.AAC.1
MHAAGSPWSLAGPPWLLERASNLPSRHCGRFQPKALMSARIAKIKHLILESLRSCTSCPQAEDLSSSAMLSGYP